MKKLIETLKNIWKIEDLRQRILITMLFVAIYRFGSFVVLPGINPALLDKLQSQTAGGLMSLLDMFSGGAFSNASIFALGIMPYISASIVMQLLAVAVPYFQKMRPVLLWHQVSAGQYSYSQQQSSWLPAVCSSFGWVSALRIRE